MIQKDIYGNEVRFDKNLLKEINSIPMNYIGNKRKILKWIYNSLKEENITLENYNVFDAFAGSGSFSLLCKKIGCKTVVSNELLKSSYISNVVLLSENIQLSKDDINKLLNHVGIYKDLLNQLKALNYNWFKDSEAKKQDMIDFVKSKSQDNKYLTFMLNYCNKYFTLKECIELASFRDYIDKLEDKDGVSTKP